MPRSRRQGCDDAMALQHALHLAALFLRAELLTDREQPISDVREARLRWLLRALAPLEAVAGPRLRPVLRAIDPAVATLALDTRTRLGARMRRVAGEVRRAVRRARRSKPPRARVS